LVAVLLEGNGDGAMAKGMLGVEIAALEEVFIRE
jgi:hypothetical protein